jgi:hypothetical protein
MNEEYNTRIELTRLIGNLLEFYQVIEDVVDITNVGMKVDSKASVDDVLYTYFCLYGEMDNRNGNFSSAKRMKRAFEKCKKFGDIPEVSSMMFRLDLARINLEKVLEGVNVTEHGYERKNDNGKLLLYKDAISSS